MPDVSQGLQSRSDVPLEILVNTGGRWAHRALLALEESGLPYRVTVIDLADKPQRLFDANPLGQVPVLAVGEPPIYLAESADIVHYVATLAPALLPKTDIERAFSSAFVQSTLRLLQPNLLPIIGKPLADHAEVARHERELDAIRKVQELLAAKGDGPFLLGERFTEADILVAPIVGRLWAYGRHGIAPAGRRTFDVISQDPEFGRFRRYVEAIYGRKSWKDTWDEGFSIGRLQLKIAKSRQPQSKSAPKYPRFLPEVFDPTETFPEPLPFKHVDRGLFADPAFPDLLGPDVITSELTPVIGTEIRGLQLQDLGIRAKDQLALLVAQRGVVVFRDQKFADLEPKEQLDFVQHFGPLYLHPADRHPPGLPQYYSIFQDSSDSSIKRNVNVIDNRASTVTWHTDGASELQPPGLTLLFILECPQAGGGDTLFTSTTEAYERLSPEFRERLQGLEAENFLAYEPKRREAPRSVHPIVRTHPVTQKRILFINEVATTHIVNYRKEESAAILSFLSGHIARAQDIACRVKWEQGTVVIWDNRSTQHTATTNFPSDQRRHLCRITSTAERPV